MENPGRRFEQWISVGVPIACVLFGVAGALPVVRWLVGIASLPTSAATGLLVALSGLVVLSFPAALVVIGARLLGVTLLERRIRRSLADGDYATARRGARSAAALALTPDLEAHFLARAARYERGLPDPPGGSSPPGDGVG